MSDHRRFTECPAGNSKKYPITLDGVSTFQSKSLGHKNSKFQNKLGLRGQETKRRPVYKGLTMQITTNFFSDFKSLANKKDCFGIDRCAFRAKGLWHSFWIAHIDNGFPNTANKLLLPALIRTYGNVQNSLLNDSTEKEPFLPSKIVQIELRVLSQL